MKSKDEVIKELLQTIADAQTVSDVSFSTGKQLISLVRELQYV